MTQDMTESELILRVEFLVDEIGFREYWDDPIFEGSSYEHTLPLFEEAFEWIIRGHFTSAAQQSREQDLIRHAQEIWPSPPDRLLTSIEMEVEPSLVRSQKFVDYLLQVQTRPGLYSFEISEWPIDRLLSEFEESYKSKNTLETVEGFLGLSSAAVAGAQITAQALAGRFAITAALKGTGPAGILITVASLLVTQIAKRKVQARIDKIDIEITTKRVPDEISNEEWIEFERRIEESYESGLEPEGLR